LKHAVNKTGGSVVKVEPAYTTMQCHMCGGIEDVDGENLLVACHNPECEMGEVAVDQDWRASLNLLAIDCGMSKPQEPLVTSPQRRFRMMKKRDRKVVVGCD
jgi:transposase